jgi:hypothetical protein
MNNNTSRNVRFDIPDFEYSPNKQEEINNQKAFLGLYYKNNYDMILDYTGYVDKNNVLKYYTIENALRDYDNLTKEVLFEQRSGYNVYSYLNFILNKRIFKNEIDDEKKQKLIKNFFTDYEKWKTMLKSKVNIDERRIQQENVSREFVELNNDQDEYGYYDTDFKGGVRKYKRKTTRKNRRKSKKSKKSKRKNKNTRKR